MAQEIAPLQTVMPATQMIQQPRELPTDFHTKITDVEFLKLALRTMWAGWYPKENENMTVQKKYGITVQDLRQFFNTDGANRIMNESCCDYIAGTLILLIHPVVQTGNLTTYEIYPQIKTKLKVLKNQLLRNYFSEHNSYQLKGADKVDDIIMFCANTYMIAAGAKGGFKMREMMESISSVTSQQIGVPIQMAPQRQPSIIDRITGRKQ